MDDQLRRQSVGPPAARSALLTLLGEFVAPYSSEVPRRVLISGLEVIGHQTAAARQAVARSVDGGWLEIHPDGDRSTMVISDQTLEMLRTGYRRIFGFGEPLAWDKRWLLLVVRVPERHRGLRDRLRTQLEWAGFGSLGGGLWISPRAERAGEARAAVESTPEVEMLGFSAEQFTGIGDPDSIVSQAWDLPAVARQYRKFIGDFEQLRPESSEAAFGAQTSMVHAWRKFPFLDPGLPDELLPGDWPREEARDLFRGRHAEWRAGAEGFFAELAGGGPAEAGAEST